MSSPLYEKAMQKTNTQKNLEDDYFYGLSGNVNAYYGNTLVNVERVALEKYE